MSKNSTEIGTKSNQRTEHVTKFDPANGTSVGTQIAMAIADATGTDVMELPPLANWVDCDAITDLFRGCYDTTISISFDYRQSRVFVSNDGRIIVSPRDHTEPEAGIPGSSG